MPTIGEAIKEAYDYGKSKGLSSLDLRLLIMKNEGFAEQMDVILSKEKEMKNYPLFKEQVRRLVEEDMPVEYVINEADFLGKKLYVDPNVLIPRSETEELVSKLSEEIANYYDPRNYLVVGDVGTGSGCIPLALREYFPNWLLVASDISSKALAVAKRNFLSYGLNVESLLGDALEPYIAKKINLDIIISNPPYIANEEEAQNSVRKYEPASALWLNKNQSVYESILRDYKKVKKGDILIVFEISPDLEEWLVSLIDKYMDKPEYVFQKDLNGFTRFLFIYEE